MIIVGAKGFAKEVLEVFYQLNKIDNIYFFDNVNTDLPDKLYNKFPIIKKEIEIEEIFKNIDNKFTLGVGLPNIRLKLYNKFISLGGEPVSVISPLANLGHFGNIIGNACNIMTGAIITNDVKIGNGVLINLNCTIGHDCIISDFVELSPGVHISGNCTIGNNTTIGTNSTIIPKIKIGSNVIIAAGSVVTKDVPDNCMIAGVPAILKKLL